MKLKSERRFNYSARGKTLRESLPSSGEAVPIDTFTEKAVLGMLFEAASEGAIVIKPLSERLRPSSFGDFRHREIFAAMQCVLESGQTSDIISVHAELARSNQLDAIGGTCYLTELGNNPLPRVNFEQHAQTLVKNESLRLSLVAANDLQRAVMSGDQSKAVATMRDVQQRLTTLAAMADGTQADDSIVSADPEPWPEPVGTDALLNEITHIFSRYVILPGHGAEALALWTLHTYVFEHGNFSPILALISPEKRCGKSTTLHLADSLTRRSLVTSNVSPAALFRVIEDQKPTMLIDEFDSLSADRQEEMRNILNGGHSRKGKTIRCVGDDNKPKAFCVYCPKMVASIGDLPETMMDRAIKLPMRRKLPDESVERLRRFDGTDTRRRLVRWARDNSTTIGTAKPALPPELNDRAADNWEILFAIAENAGDEWQARALDAAMALSGDAAQTTATLGVELLHDMEAVFGKNTTTRMTTADLIAELKAMEERPWASACFGKGISPHYLAKLLKPFGINSRTMRFGDDSTAKGYDREMLQDALLRYPLPRATLEQSVTS